MTLKERCKKNKFTYYSIKVSGKRKYVVGTIFHPNF